MLEIGLNGLEGTYFNDVRRIIVLLAFEGEDVVVGDDQPPLPPLLEELRLLFNKPLLSLIGFDLAIDEAVVDHINNQITIRSFINWIRIKLV